ncbi:hypothetical protein AMC87_PD00385 (plasmid) [Rhizobium phaseoli]|nr:hypothetical protein AMC87_PD00385 [Rhizobium phaseoli]EGE59241.1 hypothetical protein RHECNPAF_2330055 [Rhizobium etli CNPAF512]
MISSGCCGPSSCLPKRPQVARSGAPGRPPAGPPLSSGRRQRVEELLANTKVLFFEADSAGDLGDERSEKV